MANLRAVTELVMRYGALPLNGKIDADEVLKTIQER